MPTLRKLLARFSKAEREILVLLIEQIISLDWRNLDIKKLQGHQDIFRLRKGQIRIIFTKNKKAIAIINIERRSDKLYRF